VALHIFLNHKIELAGTVKNGLEPVVIPTSTSAYLPNFGTLLLSCNFSKNLFHLALENKMSTYWF
jgi:hypothetical protein